MVRVGGDDSSARRVVCFCPRLDRLPAGNVSHGAAPSRHRRALHRGVGRDPRRHTECGQDPPPSCPASASHAARPTHEECQLVTERPYPPCSEIIGLLADSLEDELSRVRRSEFDRHLAVCPSCVAYLESYCETIRMAKSSTVQAMLPDEDVPDDLIRAILAAAAK